MKRLLKSPKNLYLQELNTGGLNVGRNLNIYFNNVYLKPTYDSVFKNTELHRGQIYTYLYDPKYKDILDYYDTNPLTLIYNSWYSKEGTFLYTGINLHFLPAEIKLMILEAYWQYFYRFSANKIANLLPFTYSKFFDTVFERINKIDYKFALRTYIVSRVANPVNVPYNDWGKIPFWKPNFINGATLDSIYQEYYKR